MKRRTSSIKKVCSRSPARDKSVDGRDEKRDVRWVCAVCAGPHRTKECPMGSGVGNASGGAPGMNNMMMGMMSGPMAMPPMGPVGPMGMPPMGPMGMMAPMGMPPGVQPSGGMPPPPAGEQDHDKKREKKKQRRFREEDSSVESSNSKSSSRHTRARSRSRRREPVRIEEVERFLDENRINEEASTKIRALSPTSQRRVIARPLTGDVQNPSKVMIARVRELQSQNERMKGNDIWSAWGSAMMGATPDAINKYIEENDLDESASRQLRSLPPHQQAAALRWDLSGYRNPSAKFMSLANGLGSMGPRMPMPMLGMGMPPMMMGMRPMGMPHLGMPPMGMPPPGMPGMPGPPGALAGPTGPSGTTGSPW